MNNKIVRKYIHGYNVKGRMYYYYRRNNRRFRIHSEPDTVEFEEEIRQIETAWESNELNPPPGTLNYVIARYKGGHRWAELRASTQYSYQRAFILVESFANLPIDTLSRSRILRIRDEEIFPRHGRWMANYFVTVMSILLGYAFDLGQISANPLAQRVRHIRRLAGTPAANRPWSMHEREAVLSAAAPHVRLVLALAMCTGLRKRDVFSAKLSDMSDHRIRVRTRKRDIPVSLPIHPILADALRSRPRSSAEEICVNRSGRPWTPDGFDSVWHSLRAKLQERGEIERGLTLHGLRHTLGTLLKEAGIDDGSIADVLGQSTTAMARHYSREADLPRHVEDSVVSLRLVREFNENSSTSLSKKVANPHNERG